MRKRFSIVRFAIFGMLLTALAPAMKSVTPPPDFYPNRNTAEGEAALRRLNSGRGNTAVGYRAMNNLPAVSFNTAVGALSLATTTDLSSGSGLNVAIGFQTLSSDFTGFNNAAIGNNALLHLSTNTLAFDNCAVGANALSANINGIGSSAVGSGAMQNAQDVGNNVAFGYNALRDVNGGVNVAVGSRALVTGDGSSNVALGSRAMSHLSGSHSNNVAIGFAAGSQLGSSGDDNIDIGNVGASGDSGVVRIGTTGAQNAAFISGISGVTIAQSIGVVIDANGQLGTQTSSARVKERVRPMAKASEVLYSLQPVAFHYRPDLDPSHVPQFGLIAEEVAEVAPALVARDRQGRPYAVRYQAITAMLLNEFQKDYRTTTLEEATLDADTKRLDQLAGTIRSLEKRLAEHAEALKAFDSK